MNFAKAKTYLDKINLLYQGIQDDDQLSPIERQQSPVVQVSPKASIPALAPPPPPATPTPEVVDVPLVQPAYVAPTPTVETVAEKPKPKKFDLQLPTAKVTPAATNFNATFNELFEQKGTKDLSQKLGERPISNLKLAWGVGDKFLIINELFGKNSSAFEETIATLDGLGNMDQARAHLEKNIINKHNWTKKIVLTN